VSISDVSGQQFSVYDLADKIAFYLSLGPRHRELPENIRNAVIVHLFSPEYFANGWHLEFYDQ